MQKIFKLEKIFNVRYWRYFCYVSSEIIVLLILLQYMNKLKHEIITGDGISQNLILLNWVKNINLGKSIFKDLKDLTKRVYKMK